MSDRLDQLDYYTLLGAARGASADEIKQAFRTFAKRYHPDRFAQGAGEKRARATEIYRRGSEAFQVLSDPASRAAYDKALSQGQLRIDNEIVERARVAEKAPAAPAEPTVRSPQARAYFERAMVSAREGDYRAAWKALKAAAEIEPSNPLIERRLGQVEARLRR